MKLLFLGAGASFTAGYPLASKLRVQLEKYASQTASVDIRDAWADFEDFVNSTEGPFRRLLKNPNPEVALSLLDLLRAARESERENWEGRHVKPRAELISNGVAEGPEGHPWSDEPKEFAEVEKALTGLLRCLDRFFLSKHSQDRDVEAPARRACLARELEALRPGDLVLTTNWDTLVERVLLERGMWAPADGYGFDVDLVKHPSRDKLPSGLGAPSAIKVLKLHGSCGWYLDRKDRIYLSYPRFLQHLPLQLGGLDLYCRDALEPALPSSSDIPAVAYPTYLKRLDYRQLQRIWSSAAEAVYRAREFHAIGYSLPLSDTPIRVLLNPLRARHEKDKVQIVVDDPDPEARERWRALLGEGITARERAIGSRDY